MDVVDDDSAAVVEDCNTAVVPSGLTLTGRGQKQRKY